MAHWSSCLKPTLLAAAAALCFASATSAQSVSTLDAEGGTLWFVELTGRTVSDGALATTVAAEQARFRSAAAAAGVQYTERRSFNTLFNGLSVQVSAAQRAALARVAGVKALHPVEVIQAPQPIREEGGAPNLVSALGLTGANVAQNTLGLTGAGVKVGIIDSGIDLDHPAFGGTGVRGTTAFPNARVVAGWDFVGENFNGGNTPVPDADPRDCVSPTGDAGGHGTHVAGIVGANGGGVLGVAPGVKLGAYRVFGCNGSTTADIMVAAMERAMADGMHVINMSIGSRAQWPQYPTAQAATRLAKKGVVVVTSIGNNGPGGSLPDALYAAGAPGTGESVIGSASFDNAQRSFTVNGTPYGYTQASNSTTAPTSGSGVLARTGDPTVTNDACNARLPLPDLTGKIALIRRGTCGFLEKATNAKNAGAIAVVLYNNQAGALNANAGGVTIPVVGITQAQGGTLNGLIAAGETTLNWGTDFVAYPFGTGGLISGFSSFGLAADLSFKPNVGAPGGGILSTYPLQFGSQAVLSGTSMASPHVAGGAALILQAVPNAALGRSTIMSLNGPPPINMMTRMMNTAKPKAWSGSPGLGFLDHSFRQGAGMLDIVAAVQTQQFVVPASIATGESQAGPKLQRLTIRNDAATPVTYNLSHVAGVAAGENVANGTTSWVLSGVFDAPATVAFSAGSVVVPAKGTATVDVTVTANAGLPDRSLYGGYVVLTPQGAGTELRVPYAGLKGDYQSLTALRTVAPQNFPWVARPNGANLSKCNTPADCSFTMADATTSPVVIIQLAHQPRTLKVEVFNADTNASAGVISFDEYVGRNTTPGGTFQTPWNGSTNLGVVPNGNYFIRITALKALGDAANPAHTEVRTTGSFAIARP